MAKVPGVFQGKLNKKSERDGSLFFQSFNGWLWVVVRFSLDLPWKTRIVAWVKVCMKKIGGIIKTISILLVKAGTSLVKVYPRDR